MKFLKKNIISLGILILGLALLAAALTQKSPEPVLTLSAEHMLDSLNGYAHVTGRQARNMHGDTNAYIFVDLRSPHEYEMSHIDYAINIPVAFLLEKENQAILKGHIELGKTVVFYAQSGREAVSPWILLYQMGMTQTKVLLGGMDCFEENRVDCTTEIARYDYPAIATQGGVKKVEVIKKKAPAKKKKTIPVKKKVKVEEEGGC